MDDNEKRDSSIVCKSANPLPREKVMPLRPKPKQPENGASRVLVEDEKYEGRYVAMPSFNDRRVIASGPNRTVVRHEAKQKGYNSPLVTYISKEEE